MTKKVLPANIEISRINLEDKGIDLDDIKDPDQLEYFMKHLRVKIDAELTVFQVKQIINIIANDKD